MNKELKKYIDVVASLEIHSEYEAIAKEYVLSTLESYEQFLTKIREYIDNQSYKDLIPVELNIIKKMVDKALGESNE